MFQASVEILKWCYANAIGIHGIRSTIQDNDVWVDRHDCGWNENDWLTMTLEYGIRCWYSEFGDGAPRHDISNNVIDANRHSNAIWASYADIHDNEMVVSNDNYTICHSSRIITV